MLYLELTGFGIESWGFFLTVLHFNKLCDTYRVQRQYTGLPNWNFLSFFYTVMLFVEGRVRIYEVSIVFDLLWMYYDLPNVHAGVLDL